MIRRQTRRKNWMRLMKIPMVITFFFVPNRLLIRRMVAEDFYKNDYPDEEESSSGTCADMMLGAPS